MTRLVTMAALCTECEKSFAFDATASTNTFDAEYFSDGFVLGPSIDDPLLLCPECHSLLWRRDLAATRDDREAAITDFEWSLMRASDDKFSVDDCDPARGERTRLKSAPYLNSKDYWSAITRQIWQSPEDEKLIRTIYWWKSNQEHLRMQQSINRALDMHKITVEGTISVFEVLAMSEDAATGVQADFDNLLSAFKDYEAALIERLNRRRSSAFVDNLKALLSLTRGDGDEEALARAEMFRELREFEASARELEREFDEPWRVWAQSIRREVEKRNDQVVVISSE